MTGVEQIARVLAEHPWPYGAPHQHPDYIAALYEAGLRVVDSPEPDLREALGHIAFLRSCVASGEHLSTADILRLDGFRDRALRAATPARQVHPCPGDGCVECEVNDNPATSTPTAVWSATHDRMAEAVAQLIRATDEKNWTGRDAHLRRLRTMLATPALPELDLDADILGIALDMVDEEDARVGVVGRGRKVDRVVAQYRRLKEQTR